MAKIHSCTYCGGNVCDAQWHPTCRIAFLEDVLHQLRKLGESEIVAPTNPTRRGIAPQHQVILLGMRNILNQEQWRSKEEFEAKRAAEAARQLEADLNAGAKANWLKEQAAAWDLLHPTTKQPVSILGVGPGGGALTLQA